MIKLGVIHGGISTEHDVSEMSAESVINNLDKAKYEIHSIYINEYGKWYEIIEGKKEEVYNIVWLLKELDVVFPVLHGIGGEDGTIQGLLEMLNIPYVGCGILASATGMDKIYTKIIFEKAKISQAPYIYIRKINYEYKIIDEEFESKTIDFKEIESKIKYPMFIKPSKSGSSVGVKKATNTQELKMAIENAGQYDDKILVEQGISGKEVECAILKDKGEVIASTVGEIQSAEEFYSFDAKYNIPESKTVIPAEISKEQIEEVRKLAIKAFNAIDGNGLSRVDFFIEENTNKIYINEINTMPGFTKISMYPKLFENVGIPYSELLDKLIQNALK